MPAARGRRPPVTLRDFLELGCESSSDGFRSYPRCRPCAGALQAPAVRPVVEAELSRSPSWSPSAFFLTKSSGALARISSLSRSLSRRISFWRHREYDDLDDRDSCGFPSPLVSSCSASESSEYDESETDIVIEQTSAAVSESVSASVSESVSASASSSSADRGCMDVPGAPGDGHDKALGDGDPAVGRNSEAMEDKQQLSPVSVLDSPFDDDDGDEEERSDAGTCSPSFLQHHSHSCAAANLQRKKIAQHKFRRFDDGPTMESVVDLEARFTTMSESGEESVDDDAHGRCAHLPSNYSCGTDDIEAANTTAPRHDYEEQHRSIEERSQGQLQEPDDEYRLLARLLDDDTAASAAAVDEISEWLLLDFFAEGIGRLRSSVAGPVVGTTAKPLDGVNKVTSALVEAAMDWLRGAGPQWGIGDVMFSGESALKDMERGRRWMCVREEEDDVGVEVEAFVVDGLLDELVTELAPLVARRQLIMEPAGTAS